MYRFRSGLAMIVAAGMLVAMPSPSTTASPSITCASGFGAKVPVVVVHGWGGDSTTWTESNSAAKSRSMTGAINTVKNVKVIPFGYSTVNRRWVTDANIGPKLAKTIDCLAQASLRGGGKGKVIVVAHSMGGLVAQYASRQVVSGRKVADELGLVVTLGTPYQGSPVASTVESWRSVVCSVPTPFISCKGMETGGLKALRTGSKELAALRPFPREVPVRTIASRLDVYAQLLHSTVLYASISGDLAVGVKSATQEYTDPSRRDGGGKFIFACNLYRYAKKPFKGGECWHGQMPKTNYIQESVTNGIKEAIASPRFQGAATFFGLRLSLPPSWIVTPISSGGAELRNADADEVCRRRVVYVACPSVVIQQQGNAHDYPNPLQLGRLGQMLWCSYGPWELYQWLSVRVTRTGVVSIGGRQANYYEINLCGSTVPKETARIWEFDTGVVVLVRSTDGAPLAQIDPVLATASWS